MIGRNDAVRITESPNFDKCWIPGCKSSIGTLEGSGAHLRFRCRENRFVFEYLGRRGRGNLLYLGGYGHDGRLHHCGPDQRWIILDGFGQQDLGFSVCSGEDRRW